MARLLSLLLVLGCLGCGTRDSVTLPDPTSSILQGVSAAQWDRLAEKRIYLAHQSVGLDILQGIADIARNHPAVRINIVNRTDAFTQEAGFLSHSWIGENAEPLGKIEAFERNLAAPTGATLDAAALKLCFLDVTDDTDVQGLLEAYASAAGRIREVHPDLMLVHLTAPLTTVEQTWRRVLKKLLRGVDQRRNNAVRAQYNAALLGRFEGREPVFDLARIQSTYPDGSRCTYERDGRQVHALVPQYSRDGYHLGELGRRVVAAHLLVYLADLMDTAAAVPARGVSS